MNLLRAAVFVSLFSSAASAQSFVRLDHAPPDGALISFQMTDGAVLVQGQGESDWWKLTPDAKGSYVAGTWTAVASLPEGYQPLYFASAVLADGRLVISGGEYNFNQFAFTNLGAVYDPPKNAWTKLPAPKTWHYIGDSPSAVLPNGAFLLGRKFDKRMATLDPKTLTWTEAGNSGKADWNAEEGWTLLPSGQVLTADVKNYPNAELYTPASGSWVSTGSTQNVLAGPPYVKIVHYGHNKVYHPPGEIGPSILRPDGTVLWTGAVPRGGSTGLTAIYTPGADGAPGTWTKGPAFPNGDQAGDSFAALLPNGNVLIEGDSGTFYEFDGMSLQTSALPDQGGGYIPLMALPTGEILVGGYGVYRPAGSANPAWAPAVTKAPATLTRGKTVTVTGTQFNGLSQAAAYGDESETATNYPLARLEYQNGTVVYARTHDHSTMGVATGSAPVSTQMDVPAHAPTGAASLVIVANGIPSKPVAVTIQ